VRTMVRSTLLLWIAAGAICAAQTTPTVWTVLAVDARGDGRDSSLADAAQLSYRYDKQDDTLWFRLTLYGRPNEQSFGVNIVVDTGADNVDKMNWWGGNKAFKFDKLLTAWVTRVDGSYRGRIGVGDAAGARLNNPVNVRQDNLHIRVDGDSILIGVRRTDLTDRMQMNVIGAVGSDQIWNDDIPDARSAAVDLSAPRPARGLREIDVSRNNLRFNADYKTLPPAERPRVIRAGRGRDPLILIPGVYSGGHAFDGFISRNQSRYACYLLTPPGLNGTPARPLPPETTSYGEYTWTRSLERDILDLIRKENLHRPIIVAHGSPGSTAAEDLAVQSPDILGGVIEIASVAVQFAPSIREPGRPATLDERIGAVDAAWAQKWFKYVTPETWESNNYPSSMLANDPDRAERARVELEAAPLPVKIRYLTEFMASDHSVQLTSVTVPLLVLRPGFNETLLANPANGWFTSFFLDSWNPFSGNGRIHVITIPNARALVLDDQPKAADAAVAAFVEANRPPKSEVK